MKLQNIAATLLLIAAGSAAQAASLTLVPSATTVAQNGTFTVSLMLNAMDKPGTLYGGEILVDFDITKLTYNNFTLANGASYYLSPQVTTGGTTRTVRLGFNNAIKMGVVGTFSFTALGGPGSMAMIGLEDGDDFSGSFASYVPTYQRFYPDFVDAQVSVVPAPASLWLLGTAVGALAIRRRLRHAAG